MATSSRSATPSAGSDCERSNPTEIRAGNATWQGRRPEQQDAFGFSDFDDTRLRAHGSVLMVLADGMGGLHGGREASRLAAARLLGAWASKTPDEAITTALERALAAANRAVYELAQASAGAGSVGTTLVAVAVHDGAAHWVSVGDSRLFLYRAKTAPAPVGAILTPEARLSPEDKCASSTPKAR